MKSRPRAWILSGALLAFAGCTDDEPPAPIADPLDDPWVDAIEAEEDEQPAPTLAANAPTPEPIPAAPIADDGEADVDTDEVASEVEQADSPTPSQPAPSNAAANSPSAPQPAEDAPEPPPVDDTPPPAPAPSVEPAPAPEPAPPPSPPPITSTDFDGSFRYVGGQSQRDDVAAAIETTVQALSSALRGIARKRLTEVNPVDPTVDISVVGDKVTVTFASGFNPSCEVDGATVRTKGIDGGKLNARLRMQGNKLVHQLEGTGGGRTIVYVLSSDRKKLTIHHKITSPRLPVPVTYRLTYARN